NPIRSRSLLTSGTTFIRHLRTGDAWLVFALQALDCLEKRLHIREAVVRLVLNAFVDGGFEPGIDVGIKLRQWGRSCSAMAHRRLSIGPPRPGKLKGK